MNRNPDKSRAKIDKPYKINRERFHSHFDYKILHNDPYIVKLGRFLNSAEIKLLIDMAKDKFSRSEIVVDGEMVLSTTRTSQTAFITDDGQYGDYPKPINDILKRVCYLTGCTRNQIEGLMVVKYEEGEQYYNHHDYFLPEFKDMIADGGQRIATFFCYLNSLEKDEGGETEFPKIGIKSNPKRGSAVFWWNQNSKGKLLSKTLHRGNPIKKSTKSKDKNIVKYGLNIWIRETGW